MAKQTSKPAPTDIRGKLIAGTMKAMTNVIHGSGGSESLLIETYVKSSGRTKELPAEHTKQIKLHAGGETTSKGTVSKSSRKKSGTYNKKLGPLTTAIQYFRLKCYWGDNCIKKCSEDKLAEVRSAFNKAAGQGTSSQAWAEYLIEMASAVKSGKGGGAGIAKGQATELETI